MDETIKNNFKFKDYKNIKIACILDEFSYQSFNCECIFFPISSTDWKEELIREKPDLLFVESAWEGNNSKWLYEIANLQVNTKRTKLKQLTNWCKNNKIPTVFWSKEDPYDFDVFIEAAGYFDYVFTTDENCIEKYKKILNHNNIFTLPFAAQPKIHNPIAKDIDKIGEVAFAGGWYHKNLGDKNLDERNQYTLNILRAALKYNLHIYDRFFNTKPSFPEEFWKYIKGRVSYDEMLKLYKKYDVFLNVNSVKSSPTNFSRRVFELLACGTPILSSPSLGIQKMFSDIVKICSTEEDTTKQLESLLSSKDLRDRLSLLGQREVFKNHTYKQRLEKILNTIEINYIPENTSGVSVITCTNRPQYIEKVFSNFERQSYPNKELIIILNNNLMNIEEWKRKANTMEDVKVFQLEEKVSLGKCLNFAIEQSKFNYISKFDDDDYYGSQYLIDSMNAFKYTNASIVGKYTTYAYFEDKNLLLLKYPNKENRYMTYLSGSTLTFKKELFNYIKFNDSSISEDTTFLNEALSKGFKLYATDRFNHVICRRSSLDDHSWKISEQDFLKLCEPLCYVEDFKNIVDI